MDLPDLEVLKEIPGYQAILRAVLKTQIKMLVEQLACQAGEESVILTASVTDGSLSHMGSLCGKDFLKGRDDMKSQFLRHCLNEHHSNSSSQDKKADTWSRSLASPMSQSDSFTDHRNPPIDWHQRSVEKRHLGRARSHPYQKRNSAGYHLSQLNETGSQSASFDNDDASQQNLSTSEDSLPTESDRTTSFNEQMPKGVIVKQEPEDDSDISVVGVEMPGTGHQSNDICQSTAENSNFGSQFNEEQSSDHLSQSGTSQGAAEHGDSFQKYTSDVLCWTTSVPQKRQLSPPWVRYRNNFKVPCKLCSKLISAHNMAKHLVIHSGVRRHKCSICPKAFSQGPDLRRHLLSVHGDLFNATC